MQKASLDLNFIGWHDKIYKDSCQYTSAPNDLCLFMNLHDYS